MGSSGLRAYFLILHYIEIGKLFIKSLLNKLNYKINTADIIKLGMESDPSALIKEDLLYYALVDASLKNFIANNDYIYSCNLIIHKDATASGLQNFGLILGYKRPLSDYNLSGHD